MKHFLFTAILSILLFVNPFSECLLAQNVGIGTAAPSQRLDIDGQIRIRGGNPAVNRVLTATAADGTAEWSEVNALIDTRNGINTDNADFVELGGTLIRNTTINQDGNPMNFTNGNVAIGTTNADARLQVRNFGDGAVLLRLDLERAWQFEQDETGAASSLVLRSLVGDKSFHIRADGGEPVATFRASAGSPGLGVNTEAPTRELDVNGQVRIRGGGPSDGAVLTATDNNGNATWRVPGPHFVSLDEFRDGHTSGNWLTYNPPGVPNDARAVILQFRGGFRQGSGGTYGRQVVIRRELGADVLHLADVRSGGSNGTARATNQGVFPLSATGSFQYAIGSGWHNNDVQVYVVGYYY